MLHEAAMPLKPMTFRAGGGGCLRGIDLRLEGLPPVHEAAP